MNKLNYYNGNYELIESNGNTYEVNYLFAPEGLFGIAVKENNNPVQVYYVETDHLGSILGLYNEAGQQVYAQSFDAWGRERNPTDWSYSAGGGSKPAWLIRGYTGHEHLPEPLSPLGGVGGGLINMNGRMYDPILGRMLSPDNFVQDPSSTQSFNRYSYCWNNPLKYTDPTGEVVWFPIAIGVVVGGYLGGWADSGTHKFWTSDYWNDGWEGFLTGAVLGGIAGTGIGMPIAAKNASVALTVGQKATLSGIYSGTLNTVMHAASQEEFGFNSFGYFASGFAGGYLGASFGPTAGIMIGGIANTTAGIATGNVTDEYSLAQHFVAGALSGYAGYSLHATSAKTLSGGKYMRGYLNKNAHKIFAKYGTQSVLSDFAYDNDRKFFKKRLDYHFSNFFMGGVGGLMQTFAMSNPLNIALEQGSGRTALTFGLSMSGYGIEYMGTSLVKGNYQGVYTSGWQTKTGLSTYKALMYSLSIN